ncbi:molybdate ABC transporter substrate-binding protein [Candidatus Thioglobus sp.]|jgi:molybdate transport system substrate-binding protein|nr:molybdate ABC transporter substrate-binding protein [Candidatus Thioglobus sp.]MDB9933505.1 molybdate ABC transporter substrate-binding protein [Candidatus Thioglobus sp.]MDB9938656.1 molybdate ABC transporter substrate-binding protein [Candidatus Thioglobus sp.]
MFNAKFKIINFLLISIGLSFTQIAADEIKVAVASNFYPAMKEVVLQYELKKYRSSENHKITLISGSSGKHYAQILNGAPFDIFFSADKARPILLEKKGISETGSRFTYALGRLVLWSPLDGFIEKDEQLNNNDLRFLAIANPKIAPYGLAAREVLISMNLWEDLQSKLVRGENIAQTFQFVNSGNAKLGFISYSQLMNPSYPVVGSFWKVPQSLYTPIEQQVVLLKKSSLAKDFLSFIESDESLNIISKYGYDLP